MSKIDLQCPNGCEDGRFEALNAPVIVDRSGRYITHDAANATYICARCQSVAVDVAGAAREMQYGERRSQATIMCPACGLEMLPPEDDPFASLLECPACETRFAIEEGMARLHGDGGGSAEPE